MKKLCLIIVLLVVTLTLGFFYYYQKNYSIESKLSYDEYKPGWKTYHNKDYSISIPADSPSGDIGIKEFKSGLVYMRPNVYSFDNTTGTITEGFSIHISNPYPTFQECDINKVIDIADTEYGKCMFISSQMGSVGYGNGSLTFEKKSEDTLFFEFVSNNNRNNARGVLIRDNNGKVLALSITYSKINNEQYFSEILNSFILN